MLTNPVLDPFGKIPEFKYCAVKITKGGPAPERMSFGGGVLLPERASRAGAVSVNARLRHKWKASCTVLTTPASLHRYPGNREIAVWNSSPRMIASTRLIDSSSRSCFRQTKK